MKKTMIRFLVIAVPVATLLTLPTAPANACLSGPLPPPCAGFGGGGVEGIGTLYLDQYFNPGGTAAASGDNVLWGDYFLVGGGTGFGGDSLVSVEADPNAEPSAGGYTFYSRYTSGAGADTREPLATSFATRYLSGDGNLGVWRDSRGTQQLGPDTPAGTESMDNAIDSATIEIQDTPTPAGPPRPGGFTHPTRTITLPDGRQIQVPDGLNLNGSRVTANHGKRATRQGEITVLETADGKIYGVDANGNNLGPMHESRLQPFPDQKQYSFDDGYPLPPPSANQSAGAADDQASAQPFQDGFESGNTEAWIASDRRLKTDIVRVGALPSGLPLYRFKYIWSPATHIGVMAQEALLMYPGAVREIDGFLTVDYSRIR